MPATRSILFCTEEDVKFVLSASGVRLRLDDNADGAVSGIELNWFVRARSWGTSRVVHYLHTLYEPDDLANNEMVVQWASIIAAHWLAVRRGNPAPQSLREMLYGDGSEENRGVYGEMLDVKKGLFQLEDVGLRNAGWPAWSNVRRDIWYRVRQTRVERPISERTPTEYSQNVDHAAEHIYEW